MAFYDYFRKDAAAAKPADDTAPKLTANPGYTWLEVYENVKRINMAVSQIHTTDGRTIEIPPEEWQVMFIGLE